jgi:hypothetical protein
MTYPDGIDALVNVNATDSLAGGGHAARHNSVNTALVEIKNMLGPSPAGKILQIVRATDSTTRSTTSTSFVDASISVTITPQKSDSVLLVIWSARLGPSNSDYVFMAITNAANTVLSGAEGFVVGSTNHTGGAWLITAIGRDTPGVTSATTYKGRFRSVFGGSGEIQNASNTGQLYAIEVSA